MEPDHFEADSSLGDGESLASSTTSIRSEITRYHTEHGRQYHAYKAGTYYYPNDEIQNNQMEIEHHNQLLLLGGLHLAPIPEDAQEILDVGTGTGIWAVDMAEKYPSATIRGTDLSPIQSTWMPANVRFEIDDFRDEWTYGANQFDFIHARYLYGSIEDLPAFLKQSLNALKPGAWHESVEVEIHMFCDDGTWPQNSYCEQWADQYDIAFAKLARPWPNGPDYKKLMEEAGFVNVQVKELKRPINDWPKDPHWKEIGRFTCLNFLEGLEGFTIGPFTRILGWKPEDVQELLSNMRKEMVNRKYHGYQKGWCVWGQKPE